MTDTKQREEMMGDTVIKEKSAQPALTPDEAVELTKYLTLETFAYVIGRASQEYIHCSEMLNNIIETNRREYRRSVGKRHV